MKNSKTQSKVQTPAKTTPGKTATVKQPEAMTVILKKIENLQNLKDYYAKLKEKKSQLENALSQMNAFKEPKEDQFEQSEIPEFPFSIVLQGEGKYKGDRTNIFKISKRDTVTNFTKYLLDEVNEILEAFEKDIQNYAKEFK